MLQGYLDPLMNHPMFFPIYLTIGLRTEPNRLQKWAWRRACRRAAIAPDGPMTMDTKRALIIAADVIQQHEPPPVLMADVIQKAIEEAAGMAYNSTSWPGTRSIALRAIEMMCEEDARITHFLNQEVHGE